MIKKDPREQLLFLVGFLVSCVAHVSLAILAIVLLEINAAGALQRPQVFTVTLEGGEKLGGHNQLPDPNEKKSKAVPVAPTDPQAEKNVEETKNVEVEKKLEQPSVVNDVEKALEEKKAEEAKKLLEEKKKAELLKLDKEREEKAKKLEDEHKKQEEEKKKADEQKKRTDDEKKRAEQQRAEREKKLANAIKAAANRAKHESYDAGGEGIGAAALGGKGTGGGTLQSLEFIAYMHQLENHIKSQWHWMQSSARLVAQVQITISPAGVVQDARIVSSSGNGSFDDSVLRATYKASPVPAPPAKLYEQFRVVRITFEPQG